MNGTKRRFPGEGHDEAFYTAIAACAERLGKTAHELEAAI
jgi:hypothetical protein